MVHRDGLHSHGVRAKVDHVMTVVLVMAIKVPGRPAEPGVHHSGYCCGCPPGQERHAGQQQTYRLRCDLVSDCHAQQSYRFNVTLDLFGALQ